LRFAAIYGVGAAVGFTPQEVNGMSIWQFQAAVEGWVDAHAAAETEGQPAALSDNEKDELWDWLKAKDDPYYTPPAAMRN
jgi:hypothetical protein